MDDASTIMRLCAPPILCAHCGNLAARNKRVSREYCSDECYSARKKHLRENPSQPKCALCSLQFKRTSNRQKFCSACRPAKTKIYTSTYGALNYESILISRRSSMQKARKLNHDKFKDRNNRWRLDNKDEVNSRRRTPEHREKASSRLKKRNAEDAAFAVNNRMGSAVYSAIKGRKAGRKWETVVGYSLDDLVRHLERQFMRGMSWANMGDWHIDHIIPKSSFSYTNESDDEFRACWALSNLRPLWAEENQHKHAKRVLLI